MSNKLVTCAIFALLTVGCGADPTGDTPQDPTFAVADRAVWAGETVRVTSEYFRDHGDGVTLELADTTVSLSRVDATTMEATMPAAHAGVWGAVVNVSGDSYDLGQLTVAGFAQGRSLPIEASIAWDAYVTPVNGAPTVIGGNLNLDLAMIDLRSGTVKVVPGALNWNLLRGPGMTTTPGTWLLRSAGALERWVIDAAPHKIADLPVATMPTRQVAELTPHSLLVTSNRAWREYDRAEGADGYTESSSDDGYDDSYGLYLSAAAGKAVGRVSRAVLGVPVFDIVSGTVAYTTQYKETVGADFSADGAQLVLVGDEDSSDTPYFTVALLRASDGDSLASRWLTVEPFAVAFDPAGRWVLVGTSSFANGAWRPSLLVLDRQDLSVVAALQVPETAPVCGASGASCLGGVIAVDGDAAYLFNSFGGPAASWRFTLLDD